MFYEGRISIVGIGTMNFTFDINDPMATIPWVKRKVTSIAKTYMDLTFRASAKVALWGNGNLIEEYYVYE